MTEGLKHLNLTPLEFAQYTKSYFQRCDADMLQATIPGLAIHLGWKPNDIITFPKDSPFFPVIEHCMLLCEESLIQAMAKGKFDRSTGELLLINHFGYQKKLPEEESKGKLTISEVLDNLQKQNNG
jgi:hypothetical protein